MEYADIVQSMWHGLGWPLLRLIFFVSIGLLVANIIESFNWTHAVARLASPMIRLGNLSDIVGAAFSMAFFSGIAANSMLAEAYDSGGLSRKELVFANLFNSLPTYFLHLPTLFFISISVLGKAAFYYVGITLLAALLRTLSILVVGRMFLPSPQENCIACRLDENNRSRTWGEVLDKALERFRKRINRILLFTVPIYTLFFILNKAGFFSMTENFLAEHIGFLSWLKPESLGIVVLHLGAEIAASMAAAGALLQAGTLELKDVILALMVGNILSSPIRAIRHQFPYYSGIFKPGMAVRLIIFNQIVRVASISIVLTGYYFVF